MPRWLLAAAGSLAFGVSGAAAQTTVSVAATVPAQVSVAAPRVHAVDAGMAVRSEAPLAWSGTAIVDGLYWEVVPAVLRARESLEPVRLQGLRTGTAAAVASPVLPLRGEAVPSDGTLPVPEEDEVLVVTRVVAANS